MNIVRLPECYASVVYARLFPKLEQSVAMMKKRLDDIWHGMIMVESCDNMSLTLQKCALQIVAGAQFYRHILSPLGMLKKTLNSRQWIGVHSAF